MKTFNRYSSGLRALRHGASLLRRFVTSPIQYRRIRAKQESLTRNLRNARNQMQYQNFLDRLEQLERDLMAL